MIEGFPSRNSAGLGAKRFYRCSSQLIQDSFDRILILAQELPEFAVVRVRDLLRDFTVTLLQKPGEDFSLFGSQCEFHKASCEPTDAEPFLDGFCFSSYYRPIRCDQHHPFLLRHVSTLQGHSVTRVTAKNGYRVPQCAVRGMKHSEVLISSNTSHPRFHYGSAGINRRGVANERVVRGRPSKPPRPRVMRGQSQGCARSVDRGTCRPGIEPRSGRKSECRRGP